MSEDTAQASPLPGVEVYLEDLGEEEFWYGYAVTADLPEDTTERANVVQNIKALLFENFKRTSGTDMDRDTYRVRHIVKHGRDIFAWFADKKRAAA